jgi:hypothetical protein
MCSAREHSRISPQCSVLRLPNRSLPEFSRRLICWQFVVCEPEIALALACFTTSAIPPPAVAYMAGCCCGMLLLETCVTFAEGASINPVAEQREVASQAVSGLGCRPNRRWVFTELKQHFPYVYMPITQPWHEEFPIDWIRPPMKPELLTRAIYIASHQPLDNPLLHEEIPLLQQRH